jgi:hypothetical protein
MSYILEALKKIEREKVKKSQPVGMTSITGDLFMEQTPRPIKRAAGKIAVLVIVVSVVVSAGTWILLKDNGKKENKKLQPVVTVVPPAAIVPPPTPKVVPEPVPVTPQTPQPILLPPVPQPVLRANIPPVVHASTVQGSEDDHEELPVRKSRQRTPRTAAATVLKPELTVQAPADVKLSGIAWQDDHAARRAVINGFLLKEGAVVSGSRIAEILADRVRFSSPAGNYEIRLNSVTPTEEKR